MRHCVITTAKRRVAHQSSAAANNNSELGVLVTRISLYVFMSLIDFFRCP